LLAKAECVTGPSGLPPVELDDDAGAGELGLVLGEPDTDGDVVDVGVTLPVGLPKPA
jgi:hypothetical protein